MKQKKTITRREFLGIAGASGLVSSGLSSCTSSNTPGGTRQEPIGEMTFRTNPRTGERVSLLGYGCMRWPMMSAPDSTDKVVDQEMVNHLVDYAIAHGVNYFDTAPPYVQGLSEEATGIALSRHPRNSYYIATKMSNHHLTRRGLRGRELREASIDMYRHSLKALRTDHIDYYLMHNVGGETGIPFLMERFFNNRLIDFLIEERNAGRIRNLGFSYHRDVRVFDYLLSLHDRIHWDFVQIQLNYVDWRHASGMNFNVEYLYGEPRKRNIPCTVMETLRGGRLASLPEHLNSRLKRQRPEDSVASWAFRFAGSHPGVLTVLSGMTYRENLQDNLRTFSPLVPCTDGELALLESVAAEMAGYDAVPCTACEYCMPCPYGINIPAIFTHYNKCVYERNVPSSSQDDGYRRARRAFLVGYDRSVPRLRQAARCIGCGQCSPNCPQAIKIPEQLHRIDRFVEQLKQETL